MFIVNLKELGYDNIYPCGERVRKYFFSYGFSCITIDEKGRYCYLKTPTLKRVYNRMPWYLKMFAIKWDEKGSDTSE